MGNYRAYGATHLDRLGFIRRCRELGFSLEAVRELLRLADQKDQDCGEVDRIAQTHLAEVEAKIADLARLATELRDLSAHCAGGTIAQCCIIEALSPRSAGTSAVEVGPRDSGKTTKRSSVRPAAAPSKASRRVRPR